MFEIRMLRWALNRIILKIYHKFELIKLIYFVKNYFTFLLVVSFNFVSFVFTLSCLFKHEFPVKYIYIYILWDDMSFHPEN